MLKCIMWKFTYLWLGWRWTMCWKGWLAEWMHATLFFRPPSLYCRCFSDPLKGLDILISYKVVIATHFWTMCISACINLIYLFILLQFLDTACCQTKASKVDTLAYINQDICHTTYLITFNISGWSLLIYTY